jgi:hypothetical protein
METISEAISKIINIGIWFLILMIPILIMISFSCMIVTGFTYLYSFVSEKNYDFICDQSQILYRINQVGRISAIFSGLLILSIISIFTLLMIIF